MDPLYSSFVGAIARWAVTLAIGFLVAHHIIAVDQTTYFVEGFTHKLVVALPLLLPLAWSLWNKYRGRVKFLTALESPAGTTEAGVVAKIENGMGASVKAAGVVALACVLGAGATACGPKQYHTAVVANTSIAQAIFALQDAEIAAHTAGLIAADKHAVYKAEILQLLEAGDDLTLALKDWNPSQPIPANVGLAIGKVQRLLTDLQINSPQASALLYTVQTVLSVLRGSGVLPGDAATLRGSFQPSAVRWAEPLVRMTERRDLDPAVRPDARQRSGDYVMAAVGAALENVADRFDRRDLDLHAPILLPDVATLQASSSPSQTLQPSTPHGSSYEPATLCASCRSRSSTSRSWRSAASSFGSVIVRQILLPEVAHG